MAFPTVVGFGAKANAAVATVQPPIHASTASGDKMLLFVETSNQAATLSSAQGFTEIPVQSPQGAAGAGATTATRLTIFEKTSAASGGGTAPTIAATADHTLAIIGTFRHVSGTPEIDTTGGASSGSNSGAATGASLTAAGATTTVADCLIVVAVAKGTDTTSALWSAWANADLASVGEVADESTNLGNGGNIGVATGQKATAGAFGNTTATGGGTNRQFTVLYAVETGNAANDDDQCISS